MIHNVNREEAVEGIDQRVIYKRFAIASGHQC